MADVQAVVETQEDEEQKKPDEKPTCCKCGSSTEDFDSHSKMCRQCWNVHQMMYRHLGGAPPTLVSMKVEDQKKFYKDVGSQLKVTPKNGRWALIRAAMVKSMTHYRKEERVNSVKRKYLPLSVLEKKGFDVEAIRAHGDRRDDEVPELLSICDPAVNIQNYSISGVTAAVCIYEETHLYVFF